MVVDKIKIGNVDSIPKILNKKQYGKIISSIKSSGIKLIFQGNFKDKEEVKIEFKESVVAALRSNYLDYKGRISICRKQGLDVSNVDLNLMKVPLKNKMFRAEFTKDNLDKILFLFKLVESELSLLEKNLKD